MEKAQRSPGLMTYNSFLACCSDAARWQAANSFLMHLPSARLRADVISYNSTISTFERALEWRCSLQLLSEMFLKRLQPTVISYNSSVSACEGLGAWMQAVQLLVSAIDMRVRLDVITYSAAMSACATGKKWQEAVRLFSLCGVHMQPDTIAYNACLSACEKAGQWLPALGLLDDLRSGRAQSSNSATSDIVSYNSTISACSQASEWEQALFLLSDLDAQTLQPNLITYNSVFAALAAAATVSGLHAAQESSKALWQQITQLLLQIHSRRIDANVLTCSSALTVCQAVGKHFLTASLLGQVRSRSVRMKRSWYADVELLHLMWLSCVLQLW